MEIDHSELVRRLAKPGEAILGSLDGDRCHLWHMASCVMGEAGELFDAIKKHVVYEKPFDEKIRENTIEELGDIEFYLEGLRQRLGISREETIKANIEKLKVRYSSLEYSNASAQNRADKIGE